MESIIQIDQLTKRFPVGTGQFTALKDISLELRKG